MTSNHRAGYGTQEDKINDLIAWLRKYPDATLASGQAKLLMQRIDELSVLLFDAQVSVRALKGALRGEQEVKRNGE